MSDTAIGVIAAAVGVPAIFWALALTIVQLARSERATKRDIEIPPPMMWSETRTTAPRKDKP